jgi:hypothetical protein
VICAGGGLGGCWNVVHGSKEKHWRNQEVDGSVWQPKALVRVQQGEIVVVVTQAHRHHLQVLRRVLPRRIHCLHPAPLLLHPLQDPLLQHQGCQTEKQSVPI